MYIYTISPVYLFHFCGRVLHWSHLSETIQLAGSRSFRTYSVEEMPTLKKDEGAQARSEPVTFAVPKDWSPSGTEVAAGPSIGLASEPFPAFTTSVEDRLFQMEAAQAAQFEGLHGRLVELEQFRMADFEELKVRFSLQQRDISDLKVQLRILTDGLSECRRKLERLSDRRNTISGSDEGEEVGAVPVRRFRKKKVED